MHPLAAIPAALAASAPAGALVPAGALAPAAGALTLASAPAPLASGNSWLITPNVGLTIWTLVVFGISLYILNKVAFPRIRQALDDRRASIDESIDAAERTREQAEEVLAEYRQRLHAARGQAEEIVQHARQTAESHEREAREHGQELVAEATRRAQRDIEAATKRALDDIRREVADLTIMATEKVTRKALTEADQRRLVAEALGELDFSALSSEASSN